MSVQSPAPKILVVDDNPQNRALAQAALEDEGYEVVLANDGQEGVSRFERDNPDCVLLDVRMPSMDGPTACSRIRALPNGKDVPIVFLTAQREVDVFDRALGAGADDFLTKPVQPAELVLRVQAALKLRRIKAELREHYDLVRRQRDDLMRFQLQKDRLSQFVVHDLKNPVSTLDLLAQLLLRDKTLSESARRSVLRMRGEARTLLRMILNLLDISQGDEGRLAPRRSALQLSELAREVLSELELRAETAGVQLLADVPELSVQADESLLRRVLENLVENAIRHAPEQSQVWLRATLVGDAVELRVADAGPGVDAEARARIFEPFVQLEHGERVAVRTGRGLGLTFCKVAVEAHGGRIWIEDAQPGAVFCVSLPDGQ
ncbi:MAG TPA: hybrid sensor histidine kinase/response regulator [Polyangiales bacterium]|nr:hybrid sensor histidine kinase/response regulator [Polyangiales bacterium]